MRYYDYLLNDETYGIDETSYMERKELITALEDLPDDFFIKLRHLQPQMGCLNMCACCSQSSKGETVCWTLDRIRNVVAALKFVSKSRVLHNDTFLISTESNVHRAGVIFPYLDNDVGYYSLLGEFIKIVYENLGVKTRISTVGFSRYNNILNNMHKCINEPERIGFLGGVRVSLTSYPIGWADKTNFSREEYIQDLSNFFKIYRPYFDMYKSGRRKMCVELRYKPLIINGMVQIKEIKKHMVILIKDKIYISINEGVSLNEAKIMDAFDNTIKLTEHSEIFYYVDIKKSNIQMKNIDLLIEKLKNGCYKNYKKVIIYKLCNSEGEYFAVNPQIESTGNYGMNIYPKTPKRHFSGYLITERFFLNALLQYKLNKGLKPLDLFKNAKWEDVNNVIRLCKNIAEQYQVENENYKSEYITHEILPIIEGYSKALEAAQYPAEVFFDPDFTIDTGVICNLGRALNEFHGITEIKNAPLTPTHERNYGKFNSSMTKEGCVWRISIGCDNTVIIEKLDLSLTATVDGQCVFSKTIKLRDNDIVINAHKLNTSYLIPGQRRKNVNTFL
ncbi:MAG: hypothetical protein J1F31_06695 [Erysipelotrichales bacterium]|nr:hypothetical protein [Erysipelotrichales bacterium]